MTFHSLQVSAVRSLTDDAVELAFNVPDELRDTFHYVHGQHLGIRTTIGGEELRRTYSITSRGGDAQPRIAVKRMHEGRVSSWLTNHVHAGDTLEVMAPAGRFTAPLQPESARQWLLVAAGSGITPMLSIARSVLDGEPLSHVTMLYGNRSIDTIMFRDDLDDLKNEYMDRLAVHHVLSRERRSSELLQGRLDGERLLQLCSVTGMNAVDFDHVFVCGPEEMSDAIVAALRDGGMPDERIHIELFETSGAPAPVVADDASVVCRATVVVHGLERDVDVREDERLLDAARRAGLDVPFACTGGVCATCRAHVSEGAADMAVNHALDPIEVATGFVLTCQATPTSDTIRVDYDRP